MTNSLSFPRPNGATSRSEFERHGCRPLVDDEADALKYAETVTVLDTLLGDLSTGKVIGINSERIRVQFPNGCIFAFDTDNPDFWGEDHPTERRPPIAIEDGRGFVIVTEKPYPVAAPKRTPLFDALKASKEIGELRAQGHQIANFVQGLPTLAMYEELQNTVKALRDEVAALRNAMRRTA